MSNDISGLLLRHGNPQVSPARVLYLNQQPATFFNQDAAENPIATSGYHVYLCGYANFIYLREHPGQYGKQLHDGLIYLRSVPRPLDGYKLKNSVSVYSYSTDYFRFDYRVHSGQVEIFNIELVERLQNLRNRQEKAAVYNIQKNSNGYWDVNKKSPSDLIDTKHAAVNGQSNNLAKACWLMGAHLEYEYGTLSEYTLFHNPSIGSMGDTWESTRDKLGFTTDVTKRFATILEKTQEKDSPTYWLGHSQGGVIFTEAVRYLLNDKSSWALNNFRVNGITRKDKGTLLHKQHIAYHGNANNNTRSKWLLDRAGIKLVAIRQHDYDFVSNIIGFNTLNPRKLIGSALYANHVTAGSIPQSPHTLAQTHEQWEHNMLHAPGKGRNAIQKFAFNVYQSARSTVDLLKNYLP